MTMSTSEKQKPTQLFTAATYGYLDEINILLADPLIDPSINNNFAMRWASANGHASIVKQLLTDPRVDPSVLDNWAIRWAAMRGHYDVVDLLLDDPRVDPRDDNNAAVQLAYSNRHLDVVYLLLEDNTELSQWAKEKGLILFPEEPRFQIFKAACIWIVLLVSFWLLVLGENLNEK